MTGRVAGVLWLHTFVMGVAGFVFFLFPGEAAATWPWALPPLAARFMGSLFIGGAACSLVCVHSRDSGGLFVMVLLAAGDALIALSGILGIADIGLTPKMIGFLAFFLGAAMLLPLALLHAARATSSPAEPPLERALHAFFLIHLLVVLPVGLAMYVLPSRAQPLWPWQMAPINVRLIGSFFFGAALISVWALRQQAAEPLRPVLALYGCFASLATIASVIHFRLFDPGRMTTWAFFALYVFVAGGSWLLWLQLSRARASAHDREPSPRQFAAKQ